MLHWVSFATTCFFVSKPVHNRAVNTKNRFSMFHITVFIEVILIPDVIEFDYWELKFLYVKTVDIICDLWKLFSYRWLLFILKNCKLKYLSSNFVFHIVFPVYTSTVNRSSHCLKYNLFAFGCIWCNNDTMYSCILAEYPDTQNI